jgi:hypothetical protein
MAARDWWIIWPYGMFCAKAVTFFAFFHALRTFCVCKLWKEFLGEKPFSSPEIFPVPYCNILSFPPILALPSQVDIDQPDHNKYPAFASAACVECVVAPGDLLYIPPMWWHYVKSLEPSMSCSFWWK